MFFKITDPRCIEAYSMATIVKELNGRTWPEPEFAIVKRCIHTSADFDYADNLVFGLDAANKGVELLKDGANVVTDTKMVFAGINKSILARHGGQAFCYISDTDVAEEAKACGCTRSAVAVRKASKMEKSAIYVCGNAPTALIEIDKLIREGKYRPAMIVGVPVGFVNVVEAKDLIMQTCEEYGIPYIVAKGRKGGSNIGATIINAMLYTMGR